jgi:hypothetical protein
MQTPFVACANTHACIHAHTHACLYACVVVCMHVCVYSCMHTHLFTYTCMHIRNIQQTYEYMNNIYIYIYIYIYILHIYIYIYIYRERERERDHAVWCMISSCLSEHLDHIQLALAMRVKVGSSRVLQSLAYFCMNGVWGKAWAPGLQGS